MASTETLESIRNLISTLFNVPVESVTASSSPKTIEAWDSMGQLTLILEMEQEFGIEITHVRAQRMESVGAIADMIDEAKAG